MSNHENYKYKNFSLELPAMSQLCTPGMDEFYEQASGSSNSIEYR